MTGTPILELEFNDIGFIKDQMFNECVDDDYYQSMRKIKMTPPIGEFTMMNYRVEKEYGIPFLVTSFLNKETYKVEFDVNINC